MATIHNGSISIYNTSKNTTIPTTPAIMAGDSGFSDKNKGGLIGGIGYLGEKVASGAVQSIEGISDYAIGGIAKLFGFDKFAERQFRNDWFGDWYTSAGDWFNAGKGWSVAGDVAGGIGTSLPAMAAAIGLTLATGGAGAGAAASFLTAGLGAAGNATKEAYRETGNLGGKEFAYGALAGTLEGGLEAVTNYIGIGGGAAINSILKGTKKGAMLAAMRNGIGATMAKGFFGEAFEEGVAEIFSAPFKRATYDKDAENASANQVLYASLIGGLSGMVMGSASVYSAVRNMGRGKQIVESGETNQVLDFAKQLTERAEAEKLGDIRQFKQVSETYKALAESLKNTNGEIKTAAQRRMLGELKIDNVSAFYAPKMFNEATRVVSNAGAIAEMYATVDENGNKITYTKEQLLEGVDLDNLRKTLPTALETNEALRNVVFSSMAGEMLMDASAFQEAILSGKKFAGEADLSAFLASNPTKEQIEEVENALGIDDIYTVDAKTFNEKAQAYANSVEYDAKYDEFYQNTRDRQAIGTPLSTVSSTDGATNEATTETTEPETTSETKTETKDIRDVSLLEAMDFAKKNVKEYKNLDSENQARIRRLIRQMKANGFTDAQTRAFARVSARSNIDIVIGKEGLKRSNGTYADGKYSPDENRIYVNPEGSRSPAKLLFHELTHALYTDAESRKWLDKAAKNISEEDKRIIKALYFQDANLDETKLDKDDAALYKDEISSRYIEGILDSDILLEKLCGEHPTLKDKILNFFKGAEKDYADTPELSREAKKLYKKYKDVFDKFAERNQYADVKKQGEERYAQAQGDKYSDYDKPITMQDIEVLRSIDDKSINKFTSEDVRKTQKWAHKFYKELGVKSPFFRAWFGDWRAYDTEKVRIVDVPTIDISQASLENGNYLIKDTGWEVYAGKTLNDDTRHHSGGNRINVKALNSIDKILNNAILLDTIVSKPNTNKKSKNTAFLHKLYTTIKYGDQLYIAKSTVEEYYNETIKSPSRRAFNLKAIKIEPAGGQLGINSSSSVPNTSSINSISDLYEFVKQFDKDFTPAPEISADAAKYMLNEDGTPKVFYHGTNADFTVFRRGNKNGWLGKGIYFTENKNYAKKNGKTVVKAYLNANKLFIAKSNDHYGAFSEIKEKYPQVGELNISEVLSQNGFDGVAYTDWDKGKIIVVYNSEQIKSATDNIGTFDKSNPDTRYAISDDEIANYKNVYGNEDSADFDTDAVIKRGNPRDTGKANITVGELRKIVANNTKQKVYSKSDAISVVNRFSGISGLDTKTRNDIADAVWQILNEAPDIEHRQDIAHDMAEFVVAKVLVDTKSENPDAIEAQETLLNLRGGINKLAFTEQDISEILHRVDKDGLKRIRSRWGYKARKDANGNISTLKTPLDVYVTDVARQVQGMEYLEDMHPVDAFLEIDAIYSRAMKDSKDKWISTYWDMPDSEIPNMIKSVEEDIMNAFANEGSQSKFSKYINGRIEYYSEKADFWKSEYDKLSGRNRLLGLLMSKAQRMKDLKLGTFANSTQFESDAFKNSIGQLARINYRGSLNQQGTRGILKTIKEWYTSESVKKNILGVTKDNEGLYVQGVADMLETLTTNDVMDKGFSKEDLTTLYDVMSYFTNFVENWGKIYKRGRWVEAKPIAERFVDIIKSNESLKTGLFMRVASSSYMQTFGDPMTVARQFDRYQDGFYTDILTEMRDAAVDAQVAEMEIRSDYDAFLDKNPKYIQKASTESVTYRGLSIPRIKLIGLYMTMKRKHSWLGLAENGFAFVNAEGKHIRASGIAPASTKTEADLAKAIKGEQEIIEKLLTDADKEYIAILEKGFNEDTKKLKSDRDMQKYGFTNARSDYYYPIRRGGISENVDTDFKGELDRVSNASFNKDTVQGARQELYIESADSVYNRHIHAVCQYAYLSPAVESYNTLYNMDISGNPNKSVSIATESKNTWEKGNAYFKKLFSDIQGIPATSSEGMKALSFVRGGYAKFQLGANPKVWLTQLSSVFASSSLLDGDSITKGMTLDAKDVDKYCSLAKLRNYDNTAANAQGVLDTKTKRTMGAIGKIGDVLMSPIGKMDRFTVGRLFGACQVQVEKNGGAKVGTEANKIEAGKLLRKVILETQQNSIATERSAAMRSGNEIMRTLTMFTSDSMKVVGRVIDSIGEVSVLKARIRTLADGEAKTELQGKLKEANRKARKSVGALCMTAAYMAGIAQLFRWIYDKEQDEDETVAETMLVDAVGNLFGGLPLIKDAYGKIFEGYDINNFTYSALNDIIESAMGLFDAAGNIIKGEGTAQERNLAIRNLSYSTGQLLGIPTRNVYNVLYGLTKRFSPTTAFKIDNAFYEKNYKTELNKAIQNGDEKMTTFIMSLLMGERLDETIDETVFNEILKLTKNGQKVLPREIPDTVTIDGVEYPLTSSQIAEVQKSYAKSQQALKSLFAKSMYNSLGDEAKAEAIDFVYDTYYDKALEYTLGVDKKNNNVALSNAIGVDTLALAYLTTKGITSDTDKQGKVISGSKRKKVVSAITSMNIPTEQKLLLIASKGYALQDGDIRGLSGDSAKKILLNYILKLNISKEERIRLAEMCGFEVKNGKIIMKK